ncbi:MAG TPA: acetyltransferase [Parvibaculum sp.]|jgi:sugar O-acyltransferase (sialic acid O-acetyltransferase NeuD family)
MNTATIQIIGGGGHAKVAISTAEAAGIGIAAVFDDDASKHGRDIIGYRIAGPIPSAASWSGSTTGALIAIGDGKARQSIAKRCPARWQSLIHPTARVHASARIGVGTLICAGAVVQPDAVIGDHVIVNTGVVVEHDCEVGDFVHIAPMACLTGGCILGEGAFIGAGAVVASASRVGNWVTVGAGSVVLREVPDGLTVIGVPAKPLP